MKKALVSILVTVLLLCSFSSLPVVNANGQNPFTDSQYRFFVWDDLSGKPDKQLTIPVLGSNEDIYYYSGNRQTIYKYQSERLRIAQASGSQAVLLTTGRHANNLSTRNTEGYGCYIKNNSGSAFTFLPLLVGDDFYTMNSYATAYLVTSGGSASTVTSNGYGGVSIPNGFEGFVAVPFTSLHPNWGYTSAFVPGTASINFFCVYIDATFSQGSHYIDIDNMFLYGKNAIPNKQYLIKGGSSYIPDEPMPPSPFKDSQKDYFIWDDLSGMPDMTIPLPPIGQENAYVKRIGGTGTHVYKITDEQLQIVGASDWKDIQLKTYHNTSAAQTANAEGFGFYVNNKCGKGIAIQPIFRNGNDIFKLSIEKPVVFVDMYGNIYRDFSPNWGGVVLVPYDFEGYLLTPIDSLYKEGGGSFIPGTDGIEAFSINVNANFPNDGTRFVAFDNMFIYGDNLANTTPDALDILFPPQESTPPNTQPVAAPSDKGYNGNNIVGIDQFNRTFETVIGFKDNRDVGIFASIAHGQNGAEPAAIYDMTEFLKTPQGIAELFNPNSTVAPTNETFYWGQPLFGYYNSADEYVLRKHIEMLTLAGIDFIAFDITNANTYPSVYLKMFRIMDEYQKEGWDVPKVAFFTHSISINTMKRLYYNLYKENQYPNLWYYYKGKPLIIGYTDIMDDLDERVGSDFTDYYPTEIPTEMLNFFSFRRPQWPNEGRNHADGWPYVEWDYPQPLHTDVLSVSVASHHYALMSQAYFNRSLCWGRGYDFNTNQNVASNADRGTFFQAQWNHAFKVDPEIVFVGGWNEWSGLKLNVNGSIVFVDEFGKEFSRDVEPMKDGYEDAFYLQMIKNIRQYKGLTGKNYLDQGKTISITGLVSQWDTGTQVYRGFGTTNYGRDAFDFAGLGKYTQAAPRNNIQEIRVVNDNNYIYFYVMCEDGITPYDGSNNWMNIFIGNGTPAPGGWNGYDFVINRVVNMGTGKSDITALSSNFSGTKVGEADIAVNGRIMTLRVPRAALGLSTGQASGAEIYFKVADAVVNPASIQNYYTSGKSLPMGRLSFAYAGVIPSNIANAVNPITDPSISLHVYEDFSTRGDMQLPLVNQSQYFWQAPDPNYYSMSFNKNRLLITKTPPMNTTDFMLYLSSATSGDAEAIRGMEGIGFYVKNNTSDRIVISPLQVGDHAFYIPKGKTAKLINLGGNLSFVSDNNELSDRSSFSIPSGFEGFITFNASDFVCSWHGSSCSFTPGNFFIGYFSLRLKNFTPCSEATGECIVFDNLFFYGEGMIPYKQELIRPTTNILEDTSYGIKYLSSLGVNNGAWIVDAYNGYTLNYSYQHDGNKVAFTSGSGYNMIAFNLFPGDYGDFYVGSGSNVEGIGFYAENNTGQPLKIQPVIPCNSYSILRTYTDYYLVDMNKRLYYRQSTPSSWGGGEITLPVNFKGHVLTALNAYGNWWSTPPYVNEYLREFGVRGAFNLNGGNFVLSDVFVYGKNLANDNMAVDLFYNLSPTVFEDTSNNPTYSYTNEERLQPFWLSNTMRNECVTLIQNGSTISGKLLFPPEKIISVRDNSLNIEYIRGVDWEYDPNTNSIVRLPYSSMPYFTYNQLAGNEGHNDNCGAWGKIGNALYCIGPYLYSRQLSVTYTYDADKFSMPGTVFDANKLPRTLQKLNAGVGLKIAVFGDSILGGCDASGLYNRAPYLPVYASLLETELERVYGSEVTVHNASVGGFTSAQGASNASLINAGGFIPDLVILSFGQNDSEYTPVQTVNNIQSIMNYCRTLNPNVEFIILSTINANKDAGFVHSQSAQSVRLKGLATTGVAYVDIFAVHSYLLKRKNYIDVTGNNINHPNDFMIRIYAMETLSLLIDYASQS